MKYKVYYKSADNKNTFVIVNANNPLEAMRKAEEDNDCLPIKATQIKEKLISKKIKKLNYKEVLYIFEELYVLISSGISMGESLEEILIATQNENIKFAVENMILGLNQGKKLSSLIAEHYDDKSIVVSILKVGEKGGDFDKVLDVIISYLEDMNNNISSIIKALSYPIILMVFTFLAIVTLLVFVVPQFESIFKSFGHNLPIYTAILLNISNFVIAYGFYIFVGFVALILAFFARYKSSKDFAFTIDKIVMTKIPIVSKTLTLSFMYKITSSLEILLHAQINIVDALKLLQDSNNNKYMHHKLELAITNVKNGRTLANALKQSDLFKSSTIRLLFAGEKTGQSAQMMKRIAQMYKKDLNSYISIISKLVEPFLLIFVSGVVLFIALSIFMPIWSLSSGM